MQDPTPDTSNVPGASGAPTSLTSTLRRIVFTVGVLFVFWLIFAQAAPRLLFNAPPAPQEPDVIAAAQPAPAETPEEPPAEPRPESRPEPQTQVEPPAPEPAPAVTAHDETILQHRLDQATQMHVAAVAPALRDVGHDERLKRLEDVVLRQAETLDQLKRQTAEEQAFSRKQLSLQAAFFKLKEAVEGGRAYGSFLQMVKALAPRSAAADESLKALEPYALEGAPALAAVQSEFAGAIPVALAAQDGHSAFLSGMRSLIRIRKVGEREGDDDETRIARAEAKLARGDVQSAIDEAVSLSAPAREALSGWLGDTGSARTYLAVRQALDQLEIAIASSGESR